MAVFVLVNIALHTLDPGLSVVDTVLSDYALGDYGWLSRLGDLAAGIGLIAIALGLRATLAPGRRVAASWFLVLLAGVGFGVSGVFVTDGAEAAEVTFGGVLHIIGSLVAILGLIVAAWMLRGVFSRDAGYRYLARTQLWFAVALTVATLVMVFLIGVLGLPDPRPQRLRMDPQLVSDALDRSLSRGWILPGVQRHPGRSLNDLQAVLSRCYHDSHPSQG